MKNAALVRVMDGSGKRLRQSSCFLLRRSPAPDVAQEIATFQVLEGEFEMMESYAYTGTPEKRIAHRKLLPVATVKAGRLYGSASIPVVRL